MYTSTLRGNMLCELSSFILFLSATNPSFTISVVVFVDTGMLLRWFIALYDLEVVEEEAFLAWKEDLAQEFPGKGKALFQVCLFFCYFYEIFLTPRPEVFSGCLSVHRLVFYFLFFLWYHNNL